MIPAGPGAGAADGPGVEWAARFRAPFPRSWYDRPTLRVARDLLGSYLVRRTEGALAIARIVETEGYVARDPASHAFRGPTPRNRSMFGRAGTLYVFRIHQVHCANVVTRPGEAVLLRAAEPVAPAGAGTSGPGRLARAFGITRAEDGLDLTRSELRVLPGPRPKEGIVRAPRVGISRAKEPLYRFAIRDDRWVSRPRPARIT